jgi:hypothetical protein
LQWHGHVGAFGVFEVIAKAKTIAIFEELEQLQIIEAIW